MDWILRVRGKNYGENIMSDDTFKKYGDWQLCKACPKCKKEIEYMVFMGRAIARACQGCGFHNEEFMWKSSRVVKSYKRVKCPINVFGLFLIPRTRNELIDTRTETNFYDR